MFRVVVTVCCCSRRVYGDKALGEVNLQLIATARKVRAYQCEGDEGGEV